MACKRILKTAYQLDDAHAPGGVIFDHEQAPGGQRPFFISA